VSDSDSAAGHFDTHGYVEVISAKHEMGLDRLKSLLTELSEKRYLLGEDVVVTNVRHQAELRSAQHDLSSVRKGMEEKVSGEFLAMDIRNALEHLGNITGQIDNEEVLGSIFSRFCIGK
jgi:tRNA modification GTPase